MISILDDWQSLLNECLSHEVSAVRDRACSALPALFTEYYFKSDGTVNSSQKESVVLQFCNQLTSTDQTSRMGHAIAIGNITFKYFFIMWFSILFIIKPKYFLYIGYLICGWENSMKKQCG